MTIHQFNEKMLPEEDFVQGHIEFLVEGSSCRLLDARRTPGFILRELLVMLETWGVLDHGNNLCDCKCQIEQKEKSK